MVKFYTTDEVGAALQLAKKTLNNMLNDGRIKGVKFGRYWRIPAPEFDRICREGIQEKKAKP